MTSRFGCFCLANRFDALELALQSFRPGGLADLYNADRLYAQRLKDFLISPVQRDHPWLAVFTASAVVTVTGATGNEGRGSENRRDEESQGAT